MTSPRHIIVCGAGVVGASVAYFLARRGVRVTVIERTGVACAASGKSGGFLALDWCDNTVVEGLARASFALHATLARELAVDYGYRRMDTYMVAARETGRVPGGHQTAAPPWIDGPAIVAGAIGTTETTAQVHPARFTEALLDGARSHGATLRPGVVEAVAVREGTARGVVVDGETLEADAVVLAMGPWTGRVGGVRLPRIQGLKGYSVTLAAPDVPAHALFMDYRTADGGALEPEIIPRPDGTVYVCGMADRQPLPESADGVEVSEVGCAVLARAAGPGARGAYVATGHGPWGMLNAPATGLALAELITDGAARAVDLEPFDPARLAATRMRS